MNNTLPQDSEARKDMPLATGVFDYFPAALAEVAKLSKAGNDKHNPGEPLHWARGKSMDHADCIARHLIDRGSFDPKDGTRHTASLAWRALALLQEELEAEGAPMSRGSRVVEVEVKVPLRFKCSSAPGCKSTRVWDNYLVGEELADAINRGDCYPCDTQGCKGHVVFA